MLFLDTSALVKLVVVEDASAQLRAELDMRGLGLVASDLVRTELTRAVRRSAPGAMEMVKEVLDRLHLLGVSSEILDVAGRLDPSGLRSLDAVHIASALALGDELDALITYDDRMADAARGLGIAVSSPGVST